MGNKYKCKRKLKFVKICVIRNCLIPVNDIKLGFGSTVETKNLGFPFQQFRVKTIFSSESLGLKPWFIPSIWD